MARLAFEQENFSRGYLSRYPGDFAGLASKLGQTRFSLLKDNIEFFLEEEHRYFDSLESLCRAYLKGMEVPEGFSYRDAVSFLSRGRTIARFLNENLLDKPAAIDVTGSSGVDVVSKLVENKVRRLGSDDGE